MFYFINKKRIILIFILIALCFIGSNVYSEKPVQKADGILIKLKSKDKIYKIDQLGKNIIDWQKTILKMPSVEWAEPNYIFSAAFLPSDPLYDKQWYLDKIKAPQAWDFTKGGNKDIKIAI